MFRICIVLVCSFFLSCSNNDKPNVSSIKVNVTLQRFEKDFFKLDTNNLDEGIQQLQKTYPEFTPLFLERFIGTSPSDIKMFIQYHHFLNDSLQKKYPDFDWLKNDIKEALQFVKHYFPSYREPAFFTYIGPLNSPGIAILQNKMGIGLHQYAGKHFSFYQDPQIVEMYPMYISRRFDKEYMLPNSIKGVISEIYPDSSDGRPLIDQMVEKGKEWFLLRRFLPDVHDTLITGFTGQQQNWVKKYEGAIWTQIISTEDIFSIDPEAIQRYIGPAPFTQNMPQEYSPGNLGQWIGWQIVEKYAEKNAKLSLEQIVKTPARTIYNEAKYKPK